MYAQVEKSKENNSPAVTNSVAQKKSGVKQDFGFVDNRPKVIAQRKLKGREKVTDTTPLKGSDKESKVEIPVQIAIHQSSNHITQRKIAFVNTDDEKKQNTALHRLWEHSLVKEIREAPNHTAYIKYVGLKDRYTAQKGKITEDDTTKIVATLEVPGEESKEVLDDEKESYEVSTLHELVHAQAIFNNAFSLDPQVIHSVVINGKVKYREKIPLEEALTVVFKNEDNTIHQLHDPKSLVLLNDIMTDATKWGQFIGNIDEAEAMRKRYRVVYGGADLGDASYNTSENSVRKDQKTDMRLTYAANLTVDEGWKGSPDEDFYRKLPNLSKNGQQTALEEYPLDNPKRLPGFESTFKKIKLQVLELNRDVKLLEGDINNVILTVNTYNGPNGLGGKETVEEDFFGFEETIIHPMLPETDEEQLKLILKEANDLIEKETDLSDKVQAMDDITHWREYMEIGRLMSEIRAKKSLLNQDDIKILKQNLK